VGGVNIFSQANRRVLLKELKGPERKESSSDGGEKVKQKAVGGTFSTSQHLMKFKLRTRWGEEEESHCWALKWETNYYRFV